MKNIVLIILMLGLFAPIAAAQDFRELAKGKMKSVHFMAGIWEGEGWAYSSQGEKEYTQVKEKIVFKLDSTVLYIEGLGTRKEGEKVSVVHDALAILYYDVFQREYKMNSFISRGMSTNAQVELKENQTVVWWFKAGPVMTIRYTLTINDDVWTEYGERSSDGENWMKFFEMTLKRVN